jgi:hypothetical protein
MLLAVSAFGAIIALLGILGVLRPGGFIDVVSGPWQSRSGLYLAVLLRLVFGALLIAAASQSRFPLAFQILGIVSLAAAASIPIMGRRRIERWVAWWSVRSPVVVRVWSVAAAAFGIFLVYAAS